MKPSLVAWALYDLANSSFASIIQTFVFATYLVGSVAADKTEGVSWLGLGLGIAGLVVAVCGPILGATTDRRGNRKAYFAFFTIVLAICMLLMWFVQPAHSYFFFGLLLLSIGTAAGDFAYIFYNALLPELASPEAIGRWSGWGWGMGYLGGMLSMILCLTLFIYPNRWQADAQSIRATFIFAALWFIVFALPIFWFIPKAPMRPPLKIWDSLKQLTHYPNVLHFLFARMIFMDALITLFAFGGIYAAVQYNMDAELVLIFGITLNVSAGIGALAFAFLDDRFGAHRMILISLVGLICMGTIALWAGDATKFWLYSLLVGLFVGPAQASSRSYLAREAPEELRNQMFGLFALSSKMTSFLGPLFVSWVTFLTGSIRLGMSTILVFFVLGLILMLTVKPDTLKTKV